MAEKKTNLEYSGIIAYLLANGFEFLYKESDTAPEISDKIYLMNFPMREILEIRVIDKVAIPHKCKFPPFGWGNYIKRRKGLDKKYAHLNRDGLKIYSYQIIPDSPLEEYFIN